MSQELPQIQTQSTVGQTTQQGGQAMRQGEQAMQHTGQAMQQGEQAMQQGGQAMQHGGQAMGQAMGQQRGSRFEDSLNNEMRVALHDFVEAATICNWCADECLGDAQMERCARLCRDVGDLAALNVQFMSRDSIFGPDLAETFAYAAEECRRECAQHPHDHCQECASVLGRAVDSTWEMLDSMHGQGGSTQMQTQMSQY